MRWSTCLLTTFTFTLAACTDAIHVVRQRQHQLQQHQQQQLHASLDTLQVYDLEEAHLNVGVKQEPFDWVKKIVNLKDIGLVRKEMISHYENEWKAKYGTTAPDTVYAKPFVQNPSNGYKYALDSFGRVIEATGPVSLQTGKSKEVPTAQMVYAMYWLSRGDAMEGGDWQIGHIIAKEYNGPHDNLLNYYPQARESNQGGGAWHRMERIAASLARHMDESNPGKCAVSLKITFEFKDKDMWIPSNGVYRMEITDTCWADLGKFIALKGTDTYTTNFVKFSVVEGKSRVFQSKFIWNKADPFEDASVYPHLVKMEPMKAG